MTVIHGGDVYRNQVEYDFSINCNPLGMPKGCVRSARDAVAECGKYPDPFGEALCAEIAAKEGVEASQVLLGNGAAELIYALAQALRPRKALCLAPCFQEYEEAVKNVGGEVVDWTLHREDDFRLDPDFPTRDWGGADILFLANPNNPTGVCVDNGLLLAIARACEERGVLFCLDECFLPFLGDEQERSLKGRIGDFPHLVVLRAFTKVYGMPGLRLGYALCASKDLLRKMRDVLPPWNTSLPAQAAGRAALRDEGYLRRSRLVVEQERKRLVRELQEGLADWVCPSQANFLLFYVNELWPGELGRALLSEKILIRDCSGFRGLGPGYYRICIGTHGKNTELLRRWRNLWQNRS